MRVMPNEPLTAHRYQRGNEEGFKRALAAAGLRVVKRCGKCAGFVMTVVDEAHTNRVPDGHYVIISTAGYPLVLAVVSHRDYLKHWRVVQ